MLTSEMFRFPRSTLLTYVRCKPANSASFSWEPPFFWRPARSFDPLKCRPGLVGEAGGE